MEKLVYYEFIANIKWAIARETELKKWRRSKKDDLISEMNPEWKDLYDELL